ncbi:MAG TPA: hypothetical protein VMF09_09015 [Solirubrobacteraceae bacterium]|nr:hypothetical protein [Solirubrobacteraceae bacterium]
MSAQARPGDQAARRLAVARVRAAGRSRRAGAGAVTELARLLLRDAREAGGAAGCRQGPGVRAMAAVRSELDLARGRLSPRPRAARRA